MVDRIVLKKFLMLVVLLVLTGTLLSCQTLRKKFSREKKSKVSNEIIPVLDPIEYPASSVSPKDRYASHYALWQVWQRDFVKALRDKDSDKRLKYLLGQLLTQLDAMNSLLLPGAGDSLDGIVVGYQQVNGELDRPVAFKDYTALARSAERLGKDIRQAFTPNKIAEVLKEGL